MAIQGRGHQEPKAIHGEASRTSWPYMANVFATCVAIHGRAPQKGSAIHGRGGTSRTAWPCKAEYLKRCLAIHGHGVKRFVAILGQRLQEIRCHTWLGPHVAIHIRSPPAILAEALQPYMAGGPYMAESSWGPDAIYGNAKLAGHALSPCDLVSIGRPHPVPPSRRPAAAPAPRDGARQQGVSGPRRSGAPLGPPRRSGAPPGPPRRSGAPLGPPVGGLTAPACPQVDTDRARHAAAARRVPQRGMQFPSRGRCPDQGLDSSRSLSLMRVSAPSPLRAPSPRGRAPPRVIPHPLLCHPGGRGEGRRG